MTRMTPELAPLFPLAGGRWPSAPTYNLACHRSTYRESSFEPEALRPRRRYFATRPPRQQGGLKHWNDPKRKRYEPPLTKMLPNTEIETISETKAQDTQLFKVTCNSQGKARYVQVVTEASGKVCGLEERHGFILARIKSQQAMKKFNTKSQFNM
ncbi:hypothetical protein AVEN_170638-1 [Araneus ventricosus]|uniref:Uncharacterized protein n=1 Tax=Araneus ventricosus TaxID=182803 RepID=A0A4Y2GXY5_ARAVE|nr:hypothetical protein AVEN_170638-1 [Araneus ventricosus]